MRNKKILILVLLLMVIIAASAVITIKLIEHKKEVHLELELEKAEDEVALTLRDDLEVEFLDKVKVSDFIENLNGELLVDNEIDTTSLGEKEITFEYKSPRNKIKTKSFKINIVDTTPPVIYMSNTMTVAKGYNKKIVENVLSGDECDSNPVREIIGDYNFDVTGEYNLQFVIKDASGNEAKKDFVLKVVEKNEIKKEEKKPRVLFSDCLTNYKNENTSLGIDVSKWQGDIDWQAVKNAGAGFAFIRLSHQDGYDGEYTVDPYFVKNITGANEAGLKVGVYFYSYAKTLEDAEKQADWIYEQIKDYSVELPVVFDWESWTSFAKSGMSFYDINNVAKEFINRIESYGYKGALYSSKNYLEKIWYADEFENVWLAHYIDKTDYEGEFEFWQMCDTGRIDGIGEDVDIDVWYE